MFDSLIEGCGTGNAITLLIVTALVFLIMLFLLFAAITSWCNKLTPQIINAIGILAISVSFGLVFLLVGDLLEWVFCG